MNVPIFLLPLGEFSPFQDDINQTVIDSVDSTKSERKKRRKDPYNGVRLGLCFGTTIQCIFFSNSLAYHKDQFAFGYSTFAFFMHGLYGHYYPIPLESGKTKVFRPYVGLQGGKTFGWNPVIYGIGPDIGIDIHLLPSKRLIINPAVSVLYEGDFYFRPTAHIGLQLDF